MAFYLKQMGLALPCNALLAGGAVPKKDRQFWSPEEHQQLMRLATDPAHRQAVLGESARAAVPSQRMPKGAANGGSGHKAWP